MGDLFDSFLGGDGSSNGHAAAGVLAAQVKKLKADVEAEKVASARLLRKAQHVADVAFNRGVDAGLKRAPEAIREMARSDLHRVVRHADEFSKEGTKP